MLRTTIGTIIGGFFLAAALAGSGRAEDKACKVATDATTEVGKACKEGGIKRAKAVMKAMVKAAKTAGTKMDCDTCHKDEENWELADGAKDKFKELLKAAGK